MYFREDMQEKAVWAFSNVLNIADEGIYTQQIANANKMMASYYGMISEIDTGIGTILQKLKEKGICRRNAQKRQLLL